MPTRPLWRAAVGEANGERLLASATWRRSVESELCVRRGSELLLRRGLLDLRDDGLLFLPITFTMNNSSLAHGQCPIRPPVRLAFRVSIAKI